jgi:hypothetical protein
MAIFVALLPKKIASMSVAVGAASGASAPCSVLDVNTLTMSLINDARVDRTASTIVFPQTRNTLINEGRMYTAKARSKAAAMNVTSKTAGMRAINSIKKAATGVINGARTRATRIDSQNAAARIDSKNTAMSGVVQLPPRSGPGTSVAGGTNSAGDAATGGADPASVFPRTRISPVKLVSDTTAPSFVTTCEKIRVLSESAGRTSKFAPAAVKDMVGNDMVRDGILTETIFLRRARNYDCSAATFFALRATARSRACKYETSTSVRAAGTRERHAFGSHTAADSWTLGIKCHTFSDS